MAYNNRGWNNGYQGGGYGQGGPGGYNPRNNWGAPPPRGPQFDCGAPDRFQNPNFPYEIGQKVLHRASGIELTVISYGREQLECRKPDLTSDWFYVHELEPIENKK